MKHFALKRLRLNALTLSGKLAPQPQFFFQNKFLSKATHSYKPSCFCPAEQHRNTLRVTHCQSRPHQWWLCGLGRARASPDSCRENTLAIPRCSRAAPQIQDILFKHLHLAGFPLPAQPRAGGAQCPTGAGSESPFPVLCLAGPQRHQHGPDSPTARLGSSATGCR